MSDKYLHRHVLTDEQWRILAPTLPGGGGCKRQSTFYQRCFVDFEDRCTLARLVKRFLEMVKRASAISSMADAGIWEHILSVLAKRPDFESLMIDASYCNVHPHAAGAIGGNEGIGCIKAFGRGCA